MTRIADEAGVTRGALQHHFDDRRALMLSVVEDGYEELTSELNSLSRMDGTVRDRVDAIIDGMLRCYATSHALAAFEVVLALRDDDEFPGRHLSTIAPFAAALDKQWLELFADTGAATETIQAARQVARASVLGLILSNVVGLGPIDPNTVNGLKESVLHLLSRSVDLQNFGFTQGGAT